MNGAENGTGSTEGATGVSQSRQMAHFESAWFTFYVYWEYKFVSTCLSEMNIHARMSPKGHLEGMLQLFIVLKLWN